MKKLFIVFGLALAMGACGDDASDGSGGSGATAGSGGSTAGVGGGDGGTTGSGGEGGGIGAGGMGGSAGGAGGRGGGSADVTYPPCDFDPQPQCSAPFELCEVFGGGSAPHHCSYYCEAANECPVPTTGTATVICGGANDDVCMLDCANGTCPDGMTCVSTGQAGNDKRCAYNP